MGERVASDEDLDGTGLRVGICCGRFNRHITDRLLASCEKALADRGVADTTVVWAPGAYELPLVAQALVRDWGADAVIALGAVIRGETGHYDLVAGECAAGLQRVQLDTGVPVVFGVLTTENEEQALARSGDREDKGEESAEVAIEMANLLRSLGGNSLPADG
jgi:6,7-dimethyl-8-ribityllumazine synthase